MARPTPPSDWVAYVVVLSTVVAIMYGKYLMARGDEPIDKVIKDDIQTLEDEVIDIEKNIEQKLS